MKRIFSILFLLSVAAHAQIALIAHINSPTDQPFTTSPINTTGANTIFIVEAWDEAITTPTDNCGNTYVEIPATNTSQPGYLGIVVYAAFGASTCTSHTFSVGSPSRGGDLSSVIYAFSNLASVDQVVVGNEYYTLPTLTPTKADELVISGVSGNGATAAPASASPLTLITPFIFNDGQNYLGSAYQVQTTATAVTVTWTPTGGATLAGFVMSVFSTANPATLATTTTSLTEGYTGVAYSLQMGATGGVQPYTWTLTSGTLPTGLSLSSSGLISGTPSGTVSATPLTFKVTDNQSNTASTSGLTLTIASTPLSITTSSCPTGTQYTTYAGCTITATGGTPPYTFSWFGNPPWTAGNMPSLQGTYGALTEGLAINSSTGVISGTVLGEGSYNPQMWVNDSAGAATATQEIVFDIAGSNSVGTCTFPSDSIFHLNVSSLPVDTSPLAPIYSPYQSASIQPGFGNINYGIPFIVVPSTQPFETVIGSGYFSSAPIPWNAPMEGTRNSPPNPPESGYNGDNHVLVQGQYSGGGCYEYDLYLGYNYPNSNPTTWGDGTSDGGGVEYSAGWDMRGYTPIPQDAGNADAAGLPIIPLLENADEVIGTGTPSAPNGVITEAKRFTLEHLANGHIWPGTGQAGNDPNCTGGYSDFNGLFSQLDPPTSCTGVTGPFGEIYRLKASVYASLPSCFATSPQSMIVATGFANYGIISADGGETGAVIGTNDSRWNNSDLACLSQLHLSDFEPVQVQQLAVSWPNSDQVTGGTPTASTPTFSPVAGTYSGTQTVTISTASSGAILCYNTTGSPATNGTTGCTTGTLYSGPVTVSASETLYAVAGGTGWTDSTIGIAAYVINSAPSATFSGTITFSGSVNMQ